ncbi:MAG: hypothetical protein IJM76_05765 [Lachnospiraceae bacterium]|nr:hypothetical protein [Lachnospiraceae bacterium]
MARTGVFKVTFENGKGYTIYSEENGRYYAQNSLWWEKGGYCIPQSRRRISKISYMVMRDKYAPK